MGRYVIEANLAGATRWRPACELFPCSPSHATRKAAEAELEVRKPQAQFRRLELRVACVEPDAAEAALLRAAAVPGADGKGPVTLVPPKKKPEKAKR